MWQLAHACDAAGRELADRHYNRQKVGSSRFVPPGRCHVLTIPEKAVWATSWPFGEYVKHRWPGAWVCSIFRSEGAGQASALILDAVASTRAKYPVPERGMVTFVNRDRVKPTMVRGNPTWGWTWLKAGFEPDGETEGGLLAFRLRPENMPEPALAVGQKWGDIF